MCSGIRSFGCLICPMPPVRPVRPILEASVGVEGLALLRATLRLWPDRLEVEGRFRTFSPFRRLIALQDIKAVEWNAISDAHNLVVHLAQEGLALMVRESATWKFAIEETMAAAGLPVPGLPSRHFRDERLRQFSKRVERDAAKQQPVQTRPSASERTQPTQPADLNLLVGATIRALRTDDNGRVRLRLQGPDGSNFELPLARLELLLTLESLGQEATGDGAADQGDGQAGTGHDFDAPLPTLMVTPQP